MRLPSQVLAALANGVTLALVAVGIFYEAYRRFQTPEPVKSIELLVNLVVAFILHRPDEHEPEDLESAFLHVPGDAISSPGVIVAALVTWRTGWTLADPSKPGAGARFDGRAQASLADGLWRRTYHHSVSAPVAGRGW